MLVFALHLTGDDALGGGIARLATLLDAVIAFGVILITTSRSRRDSVVLSRSHGAAGAE